MSTASATCTPSRSTADCLQARSDEESSSQTAWMLTIAELVRRCAVETARYYRREPAADGYALELFRRAIVQRDDDAWAALYTLYAEAVRRWVSPWPGEADEGVAVAFTRFWRAVDAAKLAGFGSLAAVLRYLQLCAQAARLDRARSERARAPTAPLDEAAASLPTDEDVEEAVATRLDAAALWRLVQERVPDARERRVLHLSYAMGLSPRAICAREPSLFPEVAEVYRLKRRALDRLRALPL